MKEKAREFLDIVKTHKNVYVITGAGISTASGIPDFRGPQGLYKFFPPDIFDIEKFFENPKRYYDFARERMEVIRNAKPNVAHIALAEMERFGMISAVITQNIDRLHQKAGSRNVIELHGNADEYVCLRCGKVYDWDRVREKIEVEDVPRCDECGGLIKPNVVFFGEALPEKELLEAFKIAENSDLSVAIGTSLVVYPAAFIPRRTVETGGELVIINKGETGLDDLARVKYDLDIFEFFKEVLNLLKE